MKKNAMLKIAAILMVAVLLTTCAISSTFAKYTTTGAAGTDEARVAKWGVTVNTAITNLFVDKYDTTAGSEAITSTSMDIVAPGTEGSTELATSIEGKPEVAVEVTTAAELTLDNWTIDYTNALGVAQVDEFYCPLVFTITLNSVEKEIKMGDVIEGENVIDTQAELETAVENAIAAATKKYNAGQDLKAATDFDLKIEWKWDFSTSDANDIKDTALGNAAADALAADNEEAAPSVELKITQTVTQVDSMS